MSTRMVCCVTGSQSLILLLLSGFLKGTFVSLFSHAFALLGTYTFFRNFVFILSILFLVLEMIFHV